MAAFGDRKKPEEIRDGVRGAVGLATFGELRPSAIRARSPAFAFPALKVF